MKMDKGVIFILQNYRFIIISKHSYIHIIIVIFFYIFWYSLKGSIRQICFYHFSVGQVQRDTWSSIQEIAFTYVTNLEKY